MIIFPAIDLYEKKAVRLLRGDYNNMTVYSENPEEVAKAFFEQGARHVHLVDLEGARDGSTPNKAVVEKIARESGLFVEIGGGIRDFETVESYLECGVSRVILGTAAVKDENLLIRAAEKYGDKIAVGADIADGYIAVKGWTEKSDVTTDAFMTRMSEIGISNIICTDISKDGAMRGTNRELYRELSEKYSMNITASGGVSTIGDICELKKTGLYGAIIGKAYYTGAISLSEAIEVAK